MPKYTDLDKTLTMTNGVQIMLSETTPMTYRNTLISMCELYRPEKLGTGEAFRAYSIGCKVLKAKDSLELDEDEVTFLKMVLDHSTMIAIVVGRLTEYLNNQ